MDFRLLMLSAMYENGGNTVHRRLDGHPQMLVYPFESQLGTRLVNDHLTSMFPVKYRWPVFDLEGRPYQDYKAIIDEECKVRARTPNVSKFRHMPFDFNDDERCALFAELVGKTGRTRPRLVEAFFRATFEAWKDCQRTGEEVAYVGYSPIIVVDANKILSELPQAHVLHVVRNPWSAYADTKKRPVPLSMEAYLTGWVVNQYHALIYRDQNPQRMHIVRYEDVVESPQTVLGQVCEKMGLESAESLAIPSWNGKPLEEVYPWGTIRRASAETNKKTAQELSSQEMDLIRVLAQPYLEIFDYKGYLQS